MRKILTGFSVLLISLSGFAQRNYWTPVSEGAVNRNIFSERKRPAAFLLFNLNEAALRDALPNVPLENSVSVQASSFILTLPDAEGKLQRYSIVQSPVMEPALAAKYPGMYSLTGRGIDDPTTTVRFSFSQLGFNASIYSTVRPTVYIDKVDRTGTTYIVVARNNLMLPPEFTCLTNDIRQKEIEGEEGNVALRNADDQKLRTMRLALACTGEFSAQWQNGTETTDAQRRANVLAAMNQLMTRCNGVFEKDFGLRLNIIGDNDLIIYLDGATDPWTSEFNSTTQTTIDAQIGNADYDIGHVLVQGGNNGNAGCIGCICNSGSKGSGFTSLSNWNSDALVIDYLPHEMGHQLGGNHTFSHANEGPTIAQVEPGSGTTIMSYAGITGPVTDVAAHSHDNFHAISIQQITDNLKAKSCPVSSNIGNNTPSANAGGDFTIPHSTPFKLTGSGSDPDGDPVNFVWEQNDIASSFGTRPSATATSGPNFRSFSPTTSTSRVFPSLPFILNGSNNDTWEVLPSVGRTLNFRFTIRDNHPGGGNNNSDDMVVTVDGATGPFQVTAPNSATTWCPGAHTVTWDVAGTTGAPINTANVNILLSTDGGNTFPIVLAANTPNDGSESVTIACLKSTQARIKVEAVGNIFFDISNANFTIGDDTRPTFTAPPSLVIFKDANCNYNASTAVTGDVTDEADNCSTGLNATFTDAVAAGSCVGETIITRTWQLADGCTNTTIHLQTITIRDNTAPTFTAPANTTIFVDQNCNYNASPSITGDVTDEADNCDHTLDALYSDAVANGSCIGEKIITRTWTLADDCGNSVSHIQTILVKDNLPPVISGAAPSPATLWPPNHTMRNVVIAYTAVDNCSPVTNVLTVSSNEAVNGLGDGDTAPDWEVVNDHLVRLRAERAGPKSGRIYTITITSTDDCGNSASSSVQVSVVHDQGARAGLTEATTIKTHPGLELLIAPNPSASSFRATVSAKATAPVMLQVLDNTGRIVEMKQAAPNTVIEFGRSLRPGSYVVKILQGKEVLTTKVVKIKN